MNREIIIRGKCVDNGEWVIGSLIDAKGKDVDELPEQEAAE